MTDIEQLVDIYLHKEDTYVYKMPEEEALKYYAKMLKNGSIIVEKDGDKVVGYFEVWRVNFEQLGRIICLDEPFNAYEEDVLSGNIAYGASVWVDEDYRNGDVFKVLKMEFFLRSKDCDYFVETARRKKSQPIKVYNKNRMIRYLTGE